MKSRRVMAEIYPLGCGRLNLLPALIQIRIQKAVMPIPDITYAVLAGKIDDAKMGGYGFLSKPYLFEDQMLLCVEI